MIRHLPPPRDSFSSTGKALPFMLIFLNPVGGEESVPYNVTDATRIGTPKRYSRALKESTLYTALQVDRHVNFQSLSEIMPATVCALSAIGVHGHCARRGARPVRGDGHRHVRRVLQAVVPPAAAPPLDDTYRKFSATRTACFSVKQKLKQTISVIIGADFVVKYEWAGETVVIDKRTIMRKLLKTAGKPEDDGQLGDLVDE